MAKRKKSTKGAQRSTSPNKGSKKSDALGKLRARFLGVSKDGLSSGTAGESSTQANSRISGEKSVEQIAQEKYPDKRVVSSSCETDVMPPKSDSVSRDLNELRRKYFGITEVSSQSVDASSPAMQPNPSTGIVNLVPNSPSLDTALSQAKAKVFSDGEEIAGQG